MAGQVTVSVPPSYPVKVEVGKTDVYGDLARELVSSLQLSPSRRARKGAWHLVETWRGCERRIDQSSHVLPSVRQWGGRDDVVKLRKTADRGWSGKRTTKPLVGQNLESLLQGKVSYKKLLVLHKMVSRVARHKQRNCSSVVLHRLARGTPLWGPEEQSLLELMSCELASIKEENLSLSTDVADLNIATRRLASLLVPLYQRVTALSEQLTKIQEEVLARREEREREAAREMADKQTAMIRLKRELEIKNRLHAVQSAKVQTLRETLERKNQLLIEKRHELELVRSQEDAVHLALHVSEPVGEILPVDGEHEEDGTTREGSAPPPPTSLPPGDDDVDSATAVSTGNNDSQDQAETQTPQSRAVPRQLTQLKPLPVSPSHQSPEQSRSPLRTPEPSTPTHRRSLASSSKKRHQHVFEEKTRQLYEEESHAFLASHEKLLHGEASPEGSEVWSFNNTAAKTVTQSMSTIGQLSPDSVPSLASVPLADEFWYKSPQLSPGISNQQKFDLTRNVQAKPQGILGNPGSAMKHRNAKTKGVQFTAGAVILNAALEGELDVLRKCVKELGSCSRVSDKGATCLHNAVCSGNFPTVSYLVEMGCDINVQDVDGWTPLHCAVAYRNREIIKYLLENGASLFMELREGERPLKISLEEYELTQEMGEGGREGEAAMEAEECLKYLIDVQNSLGVTNNARVYTIFSRTTDKSDELSFLEGECLRVLERHGAVGEGWWLVVNEKGQQGYVPSNYLGIGPRYKAVL